MQKILNIAGYRFFPVEEPKLLRQELLDQFQSLQLKGTLLLSEEGININLAGEEKQVEQGLAYFQRDSRFSSIEFKKSYSKKIPFRRLRVRLKKEIITFQMKEVDPNREHALYLSPKMLKQWLDENKDFILLDTRNAYEAEIGTFSRAVTLPIRYFSEFPRALKESDLPLEKPIVTFCTGGIRCEKASLWMLKNGYREVYQLEGGILKYFEIYQNAHYQGNCFVFDERTAITPRLEETGLTQCPHCKHFLSQADQNHLNFVPWKRCQYCPDQAI